MKPSAWRLRLATTLSPLIASAWLAVPQFAAGAPLFGTGPSLGAGAGAGLEVGSDNFDNFEMRQLAGFEDVGYDTGWIPANSPVQLRIEFQAANSVLVSMFGDGLYDWDLQQIAFEGDPNGGTFRYDVGLLIHAEVQADVVGFNWTSDLLGPFDYLIEEETQFDPYLLLGNPDRPAIVSDEAEGATIASIPLLPDILIASGNLDIDLSYAVEAELSSDSILAEGPLDMVSVVFEDESLPLSADEPVDISEALAVDATLMARVDTSTTVIIRPHLVMEILGTSYDIAGIDIPVELPDMHDAWVFETQALHFDRPEPPVDPTDSSSDSGDHGDTGEDETGSNPGANDTGLGDDGCNCSADRDGGRGSAGLLGLLGLLGWTRKRRRALS